MIVNFRKHERRVTLFTFHLKKINTSGSSLMELCKTPSTFFQRTSHAAPRGGEWTLKMVSSGVRTFSKSEKCSSSTAAYSNELPWI